MRPRAFVIMPFGTKATEFAQPTEIDFDTVYRRLLEPALHAAGCDVVRSDQEPSAGDIRTEMFFELVTADLVIADITLHNANVFYELGVRDGVCPRGVFLVSGNKSAARPFDIAADRSLDYDVNLIVTDRTEDAHATDGLTQCEILAKRFSEAIAVDRQATGSPVYSHLPGLKPVNWDNIETPRAKYLNGLQSGWHSRIRIAQGNGQPGDIVTLAMNAPTRLHEARILYEAATALVALSRHSAAERILRDVIRLDPDNADAQIQLALVLCRVDKHAEAEQQLRQLSLEFRDRPRAADSLGQVLRHLWHLSWRGIERVEERRLKAIDAEQVATSAVRSFIKAHRADPAAYFAGFNALMLAHVLNELVPGSQPLLQDLTATVRYVAEHQREDAIESGKYDEQFWATTTLAGIVFMEGDSDKALAEITVACAIPAATSFQLQSFRQRLELLEELEVRTDFVQRAIKVVDSAIHNKGDGCSCGRVFLWKGCAIDAPNQSARFPASRVEAVTNAVNEVLENHWKLHKDDLAICGGMTESDVIFAEICLRLGANVRILLRRPEHGMSKTYDRPLWPFADASWRTRFQGLLRHENCTAWFDTDHLGSMSEGFSRQKIEEFAARRHTEWLINTAEMEAEPTFTSGANAHASTHLHGLFLVQPGGRDRDAAEAAFLMRRVNEFDGYQGDVKTISPMETDTLQVL